MKLIKPGKFTTSVIKCPNCEAVLEIDTRDIKFLNLNTRYVTCCECESVIFVEKNSDDTYYIPIDYDNKSCKNCKHSFKSGYEEPCNSCEDYSNWEYALSK